MYQMDGFYQMLIIMAIVLLVAYSFCEAEYYRECMLEYQQVLAMQKLEHQSQLAELRQAMRE